MSVCKRNKNINICCCCCFLHLYSFLFYYYPFYPTHRRCMTCINRNFFDEIIKKNFKNINILDFFLNIFYMNYFKYFFSFISVVLYTFKKIIYFKFYLFLYLFVIDLNSHFCFCFFICLNFF